jgi:hypothetical protein
MTGRKAIREMVIFYPRKKKYSGAKTQFKNEDILPSRKQTYDAV